MGHRVRHSPLDASRGIMNGYVARLVLAFVLSTIALHWAFGHSWYPSDCCSEGDCIETTWQDVAEVDGGAWIYYPKGIEFKGSQIRQSPDGKYHVCYDQESYKPRCIFIIRPGI